jgi:membrane protein DedA with SNARE-associated domain
VLGALVLYAVGALLGYERVYALSGKRWFILSSQKDLERGRSLMESHGGKIVLLGRCVPLIRSVVSIPAGLARMPLWRFTALTAIGSGVWNAVFIGLGWYLGENWDQVESAMGPASYVVLALVLVGIAWLVVRRLRARKGYIGTHRAP